MLAFRSLDPFRALREPDRRRRDEERLSRSEQRTLSKTQNNHLTGKAPYKFESISLQQRIINEPAATVPVMNIGVNQNKTSVGATFPYPNRTAADLTLAAPRPRTLVKGPHCMAARRLPPATKSCSRRRSKSACSSTGPA